MLRPLCGVLRDRVAAYYRSRGYRVQESARITGISGAVHAVDLWAEGPLGNLAVFLGDAGGIEGPELSSMRRAAKDLGATPVIAPGREETRLRSLAAQQGVVVLDARQLGDRASQPEPDPVWGDDPKWPQRDAPTPQRAEWPMHSRAAGRRPGEPVRLERTPARDRSLSDQVLDRLTGEPVEQPAPPKNKPQEGFGWLGAAPTGFDWLRGGHVAGSEPAPDHGSAGPSTTLDRVAGAAPRATPRPPMESVADLEGAEDEQRPAGRDYSPGPDRWVVDPRRVDELLARHGQSPARDPAGVESHVPRAEVGSVTPEAPVPEPASEAHPRQGTSTPRLDTNQQRRHAAAPSRAEAWITFALYAIAAALAGIMGWLLLS